jgi:FtsP/CotA-like multicopper oxidase with cupredoxin domain
MTDNFAETLTRRNFLRAGTGITAAVLLPKSLAAAPTIRDFRLTAGQGKANLAGGKYPSTSVWSYNGKTPGPEIRLRQGDKLKVVLDNRLSQETTIHWHGVRTPNAMDGVPHVTQKPVAPGTSFTYEFEVPDAGTYWYHPHVRTFEQVGRGLSGPLIIEERHPIKVDRDITWMLDDWRLDRDGTIVDDFGNMRDMSHAGRLGNTVTLNGRIPETVAVKPGERLRLRLINVANARIFALDFAGHTPRIIALDGQPVTPHPAPGGRVVLGPAMRADIILDIKPEAGARYTVTDTFYQRQTYRLLDLVGKGAPIRKTPPATGIALAPNPLAEPDLARAIRHDIAFEGGMMGSMRSAMMGGKRVDIREMMRNGKIWSINGIAATGKMMDPLLTLNRGQTYIFAMRNDTVWPHPIHLHGHSFRVLSRNGKATRHREWQDTVLMMPQERVEIAFVADNVGDWMFHCHILEHAAAGMTGVIRVA